MCDTCGDNRFELIEKYKQKLLDATNIGDSHEEMAVIDNILFRFWQMGWLDRLELFGNSEQLESNHVADPGKMVGDSISRAGAIETVRKAKSIGQAHRMLMQLPSAQRWIPTSERLPEGICQVIVQTNYGAIHEVFYEGKNDYGNEVWMMSDGGIYWDDEVVAWMPLPDPWKGEKDG